MALAEEVWVVICVLALAALVLCLVRLGRGFSERRRMDQCLVGVPHVVVRKKEGTHNGGRGGGGGGGGLLSRLLAPFLGQTIELLTASHPWVLMRQWATTTDLGVGATTSIYTFNYFLGKRIVYVSDAKLVRHVLQSHHRLYASSTGSTSTAAILESTTHGGSKFNKWSEGLKSLLSASEQGGSDSRGSREYHFRCLVGKQLGSSIMTSPTESEPWRKGRQQLGDGLKRLLDNDTVPFQALSAIHRVVSLLRTAEALEAPLDLAEVFSHISLQLSAEMILGLDPAECDELLPKLYLPVVAECERQAWSPWTQVLPASIVGGTAEKQRHLLSKQLDEALRSIIRIRWTLRKAEESEDHDRQRGSEQRHYHSRSESSLILSGDGSRRQTTTTSGVAAGSSNSSDQRSDTSAEVHHNSTAAATMPREPDILDSLLSHLSRDLTKEAEAEVLTQVKALLLSAHETTASTLTWTFLEVIGNSNDKKPEIAARLSQEWEDVFGAPNLAHGEVPSMEMVQRLRWAPAVIREAQRLHTPMPTMTRIALEDDVLSSTDTGLSHDVMIPQGATVILGIDAVHKKSESWPSPDEFVPQRFLDYEQELQTGTMDAFTFCPFGLGPRRCPGQQVAMLQMSMLVSYLVTAMVDSGGGGNTTTTTTSGSFLRSDERLVFELAMGKEKLVAVKERKFPLMPKHGLPIRPVGTGTSTSTASSPQQTSSSASTRDE